ncbi:MAG: GWxTD domain-containing protein [Cyclobacteriaceae bacterium]|nr:GWxTD domain-containing protein [Cyclobacteriaceae bacterium]
MKHLVFIFFVIFQTAGFSQALRDINYSYLYNPNQPFTFSMKPVRQADEWRVFYSLQVKDTTKRYSIQWEMRNALSDKEGKPVTAAESLVAIQGVYSGRVSIGMSSVVQILVAKVINLDAKQAWLFYGLLEPNYPANGYLIHQQTVVQTPYINLGKRVTVQMPSAPSIVSFYSEDFPTAAPAFSETQARVHQGIRSDSTFLVSEGEEVSFTFPGLYLVQKDTSAADGLAFRAQDDYPRLARLETLAGPLVYICTKQEYERIKAAQGDKKAFDRVILSVTGDAERAKTFMRSYFRRVELANQYFTSYKEGWKTDRGMIYIIFGLPEEVYKFADREVWTYKNAFYKVTFNFAKSSTLFDPDNFVLIRDKKYQNTWYEVIDLWRNARF